MAGERWVRLDVDYFSNPKTKPAGLRGRALHLASVCWAGQWETDGLIPRAELQDLLHQAQVPATAVELVTAAGLWLPCEGGWELPGYVERNGTRAEHEARKAKDRERQAARRRGSGQYGS